jgi:hypothetical protein
LRCRAELPFGQRALTIESRSARFASAGARGAVQICFILQQNAIGFFLTT